MRLLLVLRQVQGTFQAVGARPEPVASALEGLRFGSDADAFAALSCAHAHGFVPSAELIEAGACWRHWHWRAYRADEPLPRIVRGGVAIHNSVRQSTLAGSAVPPVESPEVAGPAAFACQVGVQDASEEGAVERAANGRLQTGQGYCTATRA